MVRRTVLNRVSIGLFLGDIVVILTVFSLGLIIHGVDIVHRPAHFLATVAPFALAWMLIGPTTGMYRRSTRTDPRWAVGRTVLAWTTTCMLGSIIRHTTLFRGDSPLIFVVVTIVVGLTVLLPWRLGVVLIAGSQATE